MRFMVYKIEELGLSLSFVHHNLVAYQHQHQTDNRHNTNGSRTYLNYLLHIITTISFTMPHLLSRPIFHLLLG